MTQLDKTTTTIMRGISILAICLHNLLHWNSLSFVQENESTFIIERPYQFFDNLQHLKTSIIFDVFYFLGFYGVPVFIFLSGYGLVKKWEKKQGNNLIFIPFFKDNYRKLFFLLIPGFLIYVILKFVQDGMFPWQNFILQITFLNDLVYNWYKPLPGVYWYFAFTLQLYVLYYLLYKYRTNSVLIYTATLSIVVLLICNPNWIKTQDALIYVRHNFIGWLYCFNLGIFWARNECVNIDNVSIIKLLLLVFSNIILLLFFSLNFYSWIFTPVIAILLCLFLSKAVNKYSMSRKTLLWVGKYSASIFVIHPIIRPFIIKAYDKGLALGVCVIIYMGIVLLLCPCYSKIVDILVLRYGKIKFKTDKKN